MGASIRDRIAALQSSSASPHVASDARFLFHTGPTSDPQGPEDLTPREGVGSSIEQKLAAIGVRLIHSLRFETLNVIQETLSCIPFPFHYQNNIQLPNVGSGAPSKTRIGLNATFFLHGPPPPPPYVSSKDSKVSGSTSLLH